MSERDFSGIQERRGRWWGPVGITLFVFGCLFAVIVVAAVAGHWMED